jgi:hypothetical protein
MDEKLLFLYQRWIFKMDEKLLFLYQRWIFNKEIGDWNRADYWKMRIDEYENQLREINKKDY